MDVLKMLAELRQQLQQVEEAIIALERMAVGRGKSRGRPPAWMTAAKAAPKRRGRPPGSKNKPEATARLAVSKVRNFHFLRLSKN
jgi:hypothetical protein